MLKQFWHMPLKANIHRHNFIKLLEIFQNHIANNKKRKGRGVFLHNPGWPQPHRQPPASAGTKQRCHHTWTQILFLFWHYYYYLLSSLESKYVIAKDSLKSYSLKKDYLRSISQAKEKQEYCFPMKQSQRRPQGHHLARGVTTINRKETVAVGWKALARLKPRSSRESYNHHWSTLEDIKINIPATSIASFASASTS